MQILFKETDGHGKVSAADKAFLQSVTVSVLGMVLCMVALCSMTWAWFSLDVSSSANSIQSARCDLAVFIDGTAIADDHFSFEKEKEYTVRITAEGSGNNAYCILRSGENSYYTVQIPIRPEGDQREDAPNYIVFKLTFSEGAQVEFIKRWGISSRYDRELEDGGYYLDFEKAAQRAEEEDVKK